MFRVIPSSKDNEKILSSKTDLPEEIYFLCPRRDYIKKVILDICLYYLYFYYLYLHYLHLYLCLYLVQTTFTFTVLVNCKLIKAMNQSKHKFSVLQPGN